MTDWMKAAEELEPAYLELLRTLVELESPTRDEESNRRLADALERALTRRGATVERHPAPGFGDHLLARIPGDEDRDRPVLLLGHMDTVHDVGTLDRFPFQVVDGRVLGPGTFDMKGGIASVLLALDLLRERGLRPTGDVRLLVTCEEEIGSPTSRPLIEEIARGSAATLVLEPSAPGGAVKTRRKGVAGYEMVVKGVPAHAGIEPEAGASAIHELARRICDVVEIGDPENGTTMNVGVIEGGTRGNVVAERAVARIDVRFWVREEAERVDAALKALSASDPRCSVRLEGGVNRWALERTEESGRLYDAAREEAAALGFELAAGRTGGASDGNLAAGVGCPTLDGLGPDGAGAHSLDEHILLQDVPRRIALVARLLRRLT